MIAAEPSRSRSAEPRNDRLVVREWCNWLADDAFQEQYLRLWREQEIPLPFNHPRWTQAWWRHFGARRRLMLLTVERAGDLRAVVPLYWDRVSFPPGRLRIVGFGTTNDYNDWLLPADVRERQEAAAVLFEHLSRRGGWSLLEVNGVRQESALASVLRAASVNGMSVSAELKQPCPAAVLTGDWQTYLSSRPRTLRYHLRSRLKRLGEAGPVEFRRATAANLPEFLRESVRLHARRWQGESDDSVYSSSERGRAFYREIIGQLHGEELADVTNLYVGAQAIASVAGFTIGNRYLYYVPAYNPAYNANVPGKLIVGHLMERAFAEGREQFDFMLGDEAYKSEWATESPRVATIALAPRNALGRAGLGSERAIRWTKRRLKQSPAVVHARDWLRLRTQ
jgi:CelD/BcsL family acetyltransferase involved in cellulose biosynthesis